MNICNTFIIYSNYQLYHFVFIWCAQLLCQFPSIERITKESTEDTVDKMHKQNDLLDEGGGAYLKVFQDKEQ